MSLLHPHSTTRWNASTCFGAFSEACPEDLRVSRTGLVPGKIGCTGQTLNEWVKKVERDSGRTPGLTTAMAAKLKALERENRELRQANEILRKASAYFAQAELGFVHASGISYGELGSN